MVAAGLRAPHALKTALIYNPVAGKLVRHPGRVREAVEILRRDGFDLELRPTTGPHMAAELARLCVAEGAERILVAGGDGTINEAANGLAGLPVPLGILPGGTANVLAAETGIGGNIVRAARNHRTCVPVAVSAGTLHRAGHPPRRFLMMAGAGLDAAIVRGVVPGVKRRLGKFAYWIGGISRLGRTLPEFEVCFDGRVVRASFALASRVRNYGGDLEICSQASLLDDHLALALFSGTSSLPYLKYFAGVLFRSIGGLRGVTLARVDEVEFRAPASAGIAIQLDGEDAGDLPARVTVERKAIRLLLPPEFRR